MKIAVAATGRDLDAQVDPRFGRCKGFVVVDGETMEFTAIDNPGGMAGGGAGIQAAQAVEAFKGGRLTEAPEASVPSHFGMR